MAERKIGIRIELNGFKGVISNIKELESELKKAKEDLTELEIGSDLFNELSGQISKAETQLGKLRKTTEGISVEKQVEGYGKLAAGITGGFAAASAAMSLFGSDTEEMSKAAVQAQNLITLALSARSLAELKTGAAIVATTIATRAEAIATSLATKETWLMNTAMKGLFTTIAANPIGAMVAVLGLAITAMLAFGDETEEQVVNMNDLNSTISETGVKLKTYTAILNSSNTSENEKLFAIKELNKEMPGFNALLDANGKITKEGNKYLSDRIKLLNLQAKSQALMNAQAQLEVEILKNKNKPLEEQLSTWDKIEGYISYLYFGDFGKQVSDATNAIENQSEANKGLEKQLQAVKDANAANIKEQADLESNMAATNKKIEEQAKKEADLKNKKTDTSKETDRQIKNNEKLGKSIENLKVQYADETEKLKKLLEITQQSIPEPKLIKELQNIITAREGLQPEKFEETMKKYGVVLADTKNGIVSVGDSLTTMGDQFGVWYSKFESDITDLYIALDWEGVQNKILEGGRELGELFKNGIINEETYVTTNKLILQYKQAVQLAKEIPPFQDVFGSAENATKEINELNDILYDLLKVEGAYGELTTEERAKIIDSDKEYQKVLERKQEWTDNYYQKLLKHYTDENNLKKENLEKEIKTIDVTEEKRKELLKKLGESGVDLEKFAQDLAKLRAEGVFNVIETIARGEAVILRFNNEFNKLMASGATNTQQVAIDLVTKNMESYVKRVQSMRKTELSDIQNQNKQIDELNKILIADGIDATKMSYKDKLALLQTFLKSEEDMITESEAKKQYTIQKTLDNLKFALDELQSSMSKISAITAQRFTLQLDKLTNEYNKDMENIVGDTKEANDKRVELEKIYQQQKKDIEKQAQVTALKFSMAQAIADGAQAILNIWSAHAANPILAGVLTGIAVGITAYQVDTINQQLQMVQSMRRGGILMGGGLAAGPSHEQGGIYAGGGSYIEGNEAIINRQSTLQYSGLLSQINQSGGGRPIMVQSPMDSRLVEALAKQNQTPIRAYVVEQDITRSQSINKRLEQLASF